VRCLAIDHRRAEVVGAQSSAIKRNQAQSSAIKRSQGVPGLRGSRRA
jgi:hypothetical protein